MNTLKNKIALVTGGGRGIGEACAVSLAEAGADVAVCSRSSGEIDAVAEKIRATGRRALAVVCDVTEADQVRRMAEELNSQFGVVEILVNNAGLGRSHRFVDHPDELWDQMLAVNLTSVYQVTKAFVPKMIEMRRGRVINIASVMSKIGGKYVAAYAAARSETPVAFVITGAGPAESVRDQQIHVARHTMRQSGVDMLDIPAFLRKQAD